MFIIDFNTHDIKEYSSSDACNFANQLIKNNNESLIGNRYFFSNDLDSAISMLHKHTHPEQYI